MKKIVAILLAVVFVLGSFAGCASNDNVESGKTITVTDMAGNTVELPTNIDLRGSNHYFGQRCSFDWHYRLY